MSATDTLPQFTDAQFIEAIRAVAAERPEYVFKSEGRDNPLYMRHGDEPGCLVGEPLARLGVPQQTLCTSRAAFDFLTDFGFSPGLIRAAQKAQDRQDMGMVWGKAVEVFNSYLDDEGPAE